MLGPYDGSEERVEWTERDIDVATAHPVGLLALSEPARGVPDIWLESFANVFAEAVAAERAPLVGIAAANPTFPQTRIRYMSAVARKRGFIPSGQPAVGKAQPKARLAALSHRPSKETAPNGRCPGERAHDRIDVPEQSGA